tara:strand:- start:780 stop:920 length:141 start_codon:yes stop_codon:yes gene_type:complete
MSVFYHNIVNTVSDEVSRGDVFVFATVVFAISFIILAPSYFERKQK